MLQVNERCMAVWFETIVTIQYTVTIQQAVRVRFTYRQTVQFLPRDAMLCKLGLSRHAVYVCLCLCVWHVRGSCQNE